MLLGGSLENHYECYVKMAVRCPVAILILGADCCDTVGGTGLPSLPGGTFCDPWLCGDRGYGNVFCWLWGEGGCGFPVYAYKRNLKKRESCLWRENFHNPERFEFYLTL